MADFSEGRVAGVDRVCPKMHRHLPSLIIFIILSLLGTSSEEPIVVKTGAEFLAAMQAALPLDIIIPSNTTVAVSTPSTISGIAWSNGTLRIAGAGPGAVLSLGWLSERSVSIAQLVRPTTGLGGGPA